LSIFPEIQIKFHSHRSQDVTVHQKKHQGVIQMLQFLSWDLQRTAGSQNEEDQEQSSKELFGKSKINENSSCFSYREVPWFQTYVVCGSVAIFLIYFCVLREENGENFSPYLPHSSNPLNLLQMSTGNSRKACTTTSLALSQPS
jgi:hypothetical protein